MPREPYKDLVREKLLPEHMLEKDEFDLTPENWAYVEESPRPHSMGPYAVWRYEGTLWEIQDVANMFDVTTEEVKRRLSEDGAGATGGGDAGDTGVGTVSFDELDTDPGEDGVRKTIRNLDQGAIDFIRGVVGASSDAEVVRKAVALAEHVLVQD
jgi:hypothetical protein